MADIDPAICLDEFAQFVNRAEAELPDDRREAGFEEVVFVFFEHDTRFRVDMPLKKPVVLREDLRD
jgi:hypothetical protein